MVRKASNGVVRIHFRKPSQSYTWVPEGLGYEVVKSAPAAHPTLAPLKPDRKWERSSVAGTVRQWLQHFSLRPPCSPLRGGSGKSGYGAFRRT
eukprot:6212419-Pleurochrysis_carterae.AAC.1